MSGSAWLSELEDGVRTLQLDRPDKANALSAALVDDLHAALDRVGPETSTLVIRGAGKHFCAGFDFADFEEQSHGALLLRFVRINELLSRLRALSVLTIAWVQGAAFGAGADMVCACMVRLGTPSARFRFPGFQFGVALGTSRLSMVVGSERARAILLGNQELDAQAALDCGLLTELVSGDVIEPLIQTRNRRWDPVSLSLLCKLTDADEVDRDLAALVKSVSRPGLHERIRAYRDS